MVIMCINDGIPMIMISYVTGGNTPRILQQVIKCRKSQDELDEFKQSKAVGNEKKSYSAGKVIALF